MTSGIAEREVTQRTRGREQAEALAVRLEHGARALAAFAEGLTEDQWNIRVPGDGRTVGVTVHHVASVYPLEIQLAQTVAGGTAIEGVTMADVHAMNARHAVEHTSVTRQETLELLRANSAAAAAAIRALTDAELLQSATVSLYENAPLTAQFVLEDHAVRHSYHHLHLLQAAVSR
jgi:hypothetical protein